MPLSPLGEKVARSGAFISRCGPGEGVPASRFTYFPCSRFATRNAPTPTSRPATASAV
jgi:hypothetical protein